MKLTCSFYCLLALFLIENQTLAQKNPKTQPVEITKTDFAQINNFVSSQAAVFGIMLDMTMEEALEIIQKNKKLYLEKDFHNTSRYYVYENNNNSKGASLFYLIWEPGKSELKEIVIFKAMEENLKGLSKELLKIRALAPWSEITNYFLGFPDQEKTILNIPSIYLTDKAYYYFERGIVIMHHKDQDGESIRFSFILEKPE
jgi:hypothetical protein